MGLLSALAGASRRSIENPSVPISTADVVGWGPTLSGTRVSEERAYGLSAWYRGVALIAGTMATLPLKVYKNETRKVATFKTVLDNPNPAQTPFEFWQTMFANALGWGNCYAEKIRDRGGIVRTAWSIHPSRVRMEIRTPDVTAPDGKHYWIRQLDGSEAHRTSREIFHLPYLSPHGFVGIPPLRFAREVLGITVAAEDTSARFYGQGARLSGVLTSKKSLNDTMADRLKARWKEKVSGPSNAGDIAVLDNDTSFQPLAIPPQDAQLLESRKFGVTEIARLFGIPPVWLGDTEKSTSWGTGIEQQKIGLVQFTLQGWLTANEQRVTREFLPGGWANGSWYAEYLLEGLLRGDSAARAAFYASAVQWGWMNRAEAREKENLDPVDGLDEFLTPSNMTLITVDGNFVPLSTKGTDDGTIDPDA